MLKARDIRSRGAAMVEFHVVALLAALPACLGTIQMALLLEDNHYIDHATYHGTRMAAMANGDLGVARRAFAQAALVLHVDASSPVDSGNAVARAGSAYAATLADMTRFARFRVVSPDAHAQDDFAIVRNGQRVIPNDSLQFRSVVAGRRSGVSIQEANILRVEVTYCRPLIVPFARQLLLGAVRLLDRDTFSQFCYSQQRIPVRSRGASPMQSDFRVSS